MKYLFLSVFLSIFLTVIAEEDEIHTLKYTSDNFSQEVGKKNHFVMFYAPWCSHCQKFSPKWEQLAEMLNEDDTNNIKIAKVDCTTDSQVCSDQDITGYPTLKFYKFGDSNGITFRGTRDLPTLTTFINEQLREGDEEVFHAPESPQPLNGLVELTDANFEKHVGTGKHFIKFYAPWCGHCQKLAPTWEQLAESLEFDSTVTIGKVDCTQYRIICNNLEVKGYPTLLWIENGKKIDKYQSDRSIESLKQYVRKMLDSNEDPMKQQDSTVTTASNDFSNELTGDTFKEAIQSGLYFVKFYAPWCGHCKRLSPTWDALREKFASIKDVNIKKIDCTLDINKQLCNDEEIEGFPTIVLYKDGIKLSEYRGSRSLEDLQDFVNNHLTHDEL